MYEYVVVFHPLQLVYGHVLYLEPLPRFFLSRTLPQLQLLCTWCSDFSGYQQQQNNWSIRNTKSDFTAVVIGLPSFPFLHLISIKS